MTLQHAGYATNRKQLFTFAAILLMSFALLPMLASPTAVAEEKKNKEKQEKKNDEFDKVITIGVKPGQMKYDLEEFSVPAGGDIKLVFDNSDGTLQHNVLILTPGDRDHAISLAQKAWSMSNPMNNDYVPDSEEVLFATSLLSPGEKETITFTAPDEPGDHPYVCTMPGHAMSMNGMMHVKKADPSGNKERPDSPEPTPDQVELKTLSYRYYEGKWKSLPSFDDLDPVESGSVQNGRVSVNPGKRSQHYGLVYEGKLRLPKKGKYRFYLASDDGSRLLIDGEQVVNNDGLHGLETKSAETTLTAGVHNLRLEYFQGKGDAGVKLAVVSPDEKQVHLSEDRVIITNIEDFVITPSSSDRVFRVRLPDASPRSIAVGLPAGTHYCFDPTVGYVRYAWTGDFLNVAPERGKVEGRGGKVCKILGERFDLGTSEHGQPIRFGNPDKKPDFSFRGYIRHDNAPPTMMYTLDGVEVRQQVRAIDGKQGIKIQYTFSKTPPGNLFYRVNRNTVNVSVPEGEWVNDSTLALPGKKSINLVLVNPK